MDRNTSPTREASPSRDERLAARLRENLHRRKAQARAAASHDPADAPDARSSQDDAQ